MTTPSSPPAREFRRGAGVLFAAIMGSGTGVAVLVAYGIGAFVPAFEREFGWTRAAIGGANLAFALGVLLAGAWAGALADRYGARRVALISQGLLAAGFAAMSLIGPSLWTLYAGYLLLPVVAAGTLPMTWTRAVIGWFDRSRGMALGLSMIATGVMGALLPSFESWMIGQVGWRTAYLGVALLPLVIGMPVALRWFREPDSALPGPATVEAGAVGHSFAQALHTLCFWQMSAAFLLAAICVGAVLTHALPLLVDRGMSMAVAAAVAGSFGVAVTAGRLISGALLDRWRAPLVALLMFGLGALACVLLLYAGVDRLLCGAAIAMVGLAAGAEADIGAFMSARYFGRSHYGAIYGLFYTIYCLGGGIGPILAGYVFDQTGSYQIALYSGVGGFAVAALGAALLRPPAGVSVASASMRS